MDETANNSDADLRARDEWVAGLDLEGKEELLFEIDMLLRGLDRFFNLDNLFFSNREEIIQRDFTEEMGIVTQLLKRLVSLTAKLSGSTLASLSLHRSRQFIPPPLSGPSQQYTDRPLEIEWAARLGGRCPLQPGHAPARL
jgi:hypothetical protein